MVWLALIGLTVWLVIQQNTLGALRRELTALRQLLASLQPKPEPKPLEVGQITPAMEAAARVAAEAAMPAPPSTSVPTVPAPQPTLDPEPMVTATFEPVSQPFIAPPARPAPTPVTRAVVERWLAEKGLAWIGGSALVIGGAFLVGYAAQAGFFTPRLRIIAAAILGVAMLAAGELIRRRRLGGFGRNPLASAIVSGAGASVLYGTTWAAYSLYGFITGAECGGLLAAIAWSLLGLAFIHGEALAVLAIGGAFVAPLISGADAWGVQALTLYLGILIATGVAVGWVRSWPAALWTTIVAAGLWALLAAFQIQSLKCLLLGLEPLTALAVLAWALPRPARGGVGIGATVAASLAAFFALVSAAAHGHPAPEGVIAAVVLPLAVAALQRRGAAPAWAMAGPGVAFTLTAAFARLGGVSSLTLTEIWCLQVLMLDAASLWAAWRSEQRAMSGVGALSSLALGLIAGGGFGLGPLATIGPAVACVALALGALRLATDRSKPVDRRALEIWGGASAAALLASIAVGFSWQWAGFGFAAAALGLAFAGRWLGWRSVAWSAAAGAALGLAALLAPTMLTHALRGGADAWFYLAAALALAVASFLSARIVATDVPAAEALRTLSPLAALVGAFVFLRWMAGGAGGVPPDGLTEASIRTFLIADAGLVSLARSGAEQTRFARFRGHALMLAAAFHGLVFQVWIYNPRIGFFGDVVGGPPLFDTLAIAFAAPAIVFGAGAARIYRDQREAGRAYAVIALLSGVSWTFLEIRRLVHWPHLGGGPKTIGAAESVACSLVLLALALAADRLRRREPAQPLLADAGRLASFLRIVAVAFAVVMAGLWSNPCWGAAERTTAGWGPVAALFVGYAMIVALSALAAADAYRAGSEREGDTIAGAAIFLGLILASLIVRAGFHGPSLTLDAGTSQLETWSYSAVGALAGLGFVAVSRGGRRLFLRAGLALLLLTTAKVFIVDTASLSGVVRAGSFLALGVLLLLGALTARRSSRPPAPAEAPPS
jgi:uncharacterized membrane protein